MHPTPTRSVAAVGDVTDIRCWSGIPYHFFRAARTAGFATVPWRLDLSRFRSLRWRWNSVQLLRGRRPGGFQYSREFLERAANQLPRELASSEVISFNQHFPPWEHLQEAGGGLNLFIDATFPDLLSRYGLASRMDRQTAEAALARERETFAFSQRIIGFQRWCSGSAVRDCGADPKRVFTICPGANLELPENFQFFSPGTGRAGRERPMVLGFVGQDWRRKGLPFLADVRDALARRGWRVEIRALGFDPKEFRSREGVHPLGFISKRTELARFLKLVGTCDMGCLFSSSEATGMSTLEFLRLGVPVAGFDVDGMGDCIPTDAGFRFAHETKADAVADTFDSYLQDEVKQEKFRCAARLWSPLVTWERCIAEMEELWQNGCVASPVQMSGLLQSAKARLRNE